MTMPILPFAGPLESLAAPAGADTPITGLPFASVLGNALGAGGTGAPLQLPALLAQLLGRSTSRNALSVLPDRPSNPAAPGEGGLTLDQLGPEQLQLLIDALTADRQAPTARLPIAPGTARTEGSPNGALDIGALPEATRQALLEALTAQVPLLVERYARRTKDNGEALVDATNAPMTAPDMRLMPTVAPGGLPVLGSVTTPAALGLAAGALDPSIAGNASAVARTLRTAFANTDPTAIRRELTSLRPEFRDRLEQLIDRMQREFGYTVEVVETVRSQTRQDALFAQGRTAPGPVVTWTRTSPHQEARAADVMIDGGYDNSEAFARLARIAKEAGLRTLWPRDPGHIEMPVSLPLQTARAIPSSTVTPAVEAPTAPTPPRGPVVAGTRAGIQRLAMPQPTSVLALPFGEIDTSMGRRPLAPTVLMPTEDAAVPPARTFAPRSHSAVAQVASVAQVAAVAGVAQPARVADVATVAALEGSPVSRPDMRPLARAPRPTTIAPANATAVTTPRDGKIAESAPSLDGMVDRVIAAVNDHLARDEQRGGARDERGAERDLVAAVRERVEAGGGREAMRTVDPLASRGDGVTRTEAPTPVNMTDRVARAMEIRDAAAERPLSSVLLRLDHPEGGEDRIRIDLRGHSVSTVMDVRDPVAADRLATHAPELSRALAQHGLEPEAVTIRAIRPDTALTGAANVATERDGGRVASSSNTSDSSTTGQDRHPRDPNRAYDHQNGDGRSRHRRDPKGSR